MKVDTWLFLEKLFKSLWIFFIAVCFICIFISNIVDLFLIGVGVSALISLSSFILWQCLYYYDEEDESYGFRGDR